MASTAGIGLVCEYCEEMQTTEKAADYGMCNDCFERSDWFCESCKSPEGSFCDHK